MFTKIVSGEPLRREKGGKRKREAKYSDVGYGEATVQDMMYVTINH